MRERVSPDRPYAIGLRLSDLASRQLSEPRDARPAFRRWLHAATTATFSRSTDFPFGQFHGTKVKEQVYRPDWTHPDRLAYTNRLFDLLAQLVPEGVEGSVSTLPGSFKEFISTHGRAKERKFASISGVASTISSAAPRAMAASCISAWNRNRSACLRPARRPSAFLPGNGRRHRPKATRACAPFSASITTPAISRSNTRNRPTSSRRCKRKAFASAKFISAPRCSLRLTNASARMAAPFRRRYLSAPGRRANRRWLASPRQGPRCRAGEKPDGDREWRIHFHVPLHATTLSHGQTTASHLLGLLDLLAKQPSLCSHLEMETYTWEVLPEELRAKSVVDQLVREYDWCLGPTRATRPVRQKQMKASLILSRIRPEIPSSSSGASPILPTVWSNFSWDGSDRAGEGRIRSTSSHSSGPCSSCSAEAFSTSVACISTITATQISMRNIARSAHSGWKDFPPHRRHHRRLWFTAAGSRASTSSRAARCTIVALLLDRRHRSLRFSPQERRLGRRSSWAFCRCPALSMAARRIFICSSIFCTNLSTGSPTSFNFVESRWDSTWRASPISPAAASRLIRTTGSLGRSSCCESPPAHAWAGSHLPPTSLFPIGCLRRDPNHASLGLHCPLDFLPLILRLCFSLDGVAWLIPLWRGNKPSIGRVVSGLLAGIVLVDMIA